ncbi:MAG: hypothetical protein R6X20_02265 [Phycisphaerae bacterium]
MAAKRKTRKKRNGRRKRKTKPARPLRLEWRLAGDLADNPRNWRRHPEGQQEDLAMLLQEVGWAGALVYNEELGRLVDGHARKAVAKRLNPATEVPVLVGSWDEATERKILATLDPLGELTATDSEALADLLEQVDVSGFGDLGDLLAERAAGGGPDKDGFDEQEPPDACTSPSGDLWRLGRHRLLCGDSTKSETIDRLPNKPPLNSMLFDPPFEADYSAWAIPPSVNHVAVMGRGTQLYTWLGAGPLAGWKGFEIVATGSAQGNALDNMPCCVYVTAHVLVRPKQKRVYDPDALRLSGVERTEDGRGFSVISHTLRHSPENPHRKPLKFVCAIMASFPGKSDGAVLDPCAGGGTSIVAAEQTGRTCRAIEVDPLLCDVAVRRWQYFAGTKAKLDGTKKTFAQIAAARNR